MARQPKKAQRYEVWAEWDDGFDALVCDRGKTFTKQQAQDIIDDPAIREIYDGARLYMSPV